MDFSIISEHPSQLHQTPQTLKFVLAENGSLDEYPLAEFVSPLSPKNSNTLMDFIEKEYRIPQADQVILRAGDGKQLENSMNLREFFEKDQAIHIFNTKFCGEAAISDDFEVICPTNPGKNDWSELEFDSLPEIHELYMGTEGKVDMDSVKSVKLNELITIFCDVKNEINSLKEASVKLQRQKDSESVVKKNLMGYYVDKKKKFDETFSQMKTKILNFQTLLTDFDSNLEILSKQEVDVQLGDKDKTYLIDYFDIAKAQSNKAIYEKNQAKIMTKCQEMENEIFAYNEQLTKIEENIPNYYLEIIELIQEQEKSLMKIHDTSLQGIQSVNRDKSTSLQDPNAFTKEWEASIPKLREMFQKVQQIRAKLDMYLKENAVRLGNFVSDVANIQLLIRGKLYNKHTVFRSLVEKHEKDIFNLEAIVQFPSTYQASIDEIQRRYMAKRECLTILNILENFINSENKLREEFSKNYSAYLPKTFCPILSKGFPHINFDYLCKLVDSDGSFCVKEAPPSPSKMNGSGDVIKLLKSFSVSAQAKEVRIQELEDTLLMHQEEIKRLKEQYKFKNFGVNDFNRLLGSVDIQEKFDSMLKGLTGNCEGKLADLSARLNTLKTQGLQTFEGLLQEIRHEVESEAHGDSKKNVVELLREMKRKSENSIENLNKELERKKMEKEMITVCFEKAQKKLDEVFKEREDLTKERAELEEMIDSLNRKIYMMEKVEDGLEEELYDMQQDLDANQEVISSLNTNLRNKEKELNALTEKANYLTKMAEENDKVIQECREQMLILWEKLADKDNELRDIHALFNKVSEEAQLLKDQNDKLEGLIAKKDELITSVQEKLMNKQTKIKLLEKRMTEKEEELKIAVDNLDMCQEEIQLISQQNFQLESNYEGLREENTELSIQKEDLMSNIRAIEANLHTSESNNKEIQATLMDKEEEIQRLKYERELLIEEIQDLKREKSQLDEIIRDDVAQEFILHIEKLEDCLNEKDEKMKALQEKLDLLEKTSEIPKLEKSTQGGMEEEHEVSANPRIDWGPSKDELGEVALTFYTTLLGGYIKEKMNTNSDCPLEILNNIPSLLGKLSLKLQDLKRGDKVLGFKFPGQNHYQLVQLDDFSVNIPSMYYFAREDYGEFIVGTLDDLGYIKNSKDSRRQGRKQGSTAIQYVQLANVKGICLGDIQRQVSYS